MNVNESRSGDFLILEPVGFLDSRTSNAFEKKIAAHTKAGTRRFIIDLVSTEYMSSAGLRVLLMLAKKCDSVDGELVLCSLNESVREVFDIAGFHTVFIIEPDRVAALANAQAKPKETRVFQLAARLLAVRKQAGDEKPRVDEATVRLMNRAGELLSIAEQRDGQASTMRRKSVSLKSGRNRLA